MQTFVYEILCFLFELIGASNPLGKARMADQRSNLCDRISKSQVPTPNLRIAEVTFQEN